MSDKRPPRSETGRARGDGPLQVGEIVKRLQLDRRPADAPIAPRGRASRVMTGRLKAHGRANYQFEPHGSPSYYVEILSSRGVETLWGVDLERAITKSKTHPKIGAIVGVQRLGSDPVTIPAREGDPKTAQQRTFRRARWVVEEVTFFAETIRHARRDREAQLADSAALRERPELRSAYISLRIAEKFAEQNIRDPRDRVLFVERVKAVMALSARSTAPTERKPPTASRREDPTR
jgi:hypothetical protein